jgi:hypothetical protein
MLMDGLAFFAAEVVYNDPDTAWKVLGPWEYSQ